MQPKTWKTTNRKRRQISDILTIYENCRAFKGNAKVTNNSNHKEMAFSVKSYNKATFDVDTKDFEYAKLSTLKTDGTTYVLNGIYVNQSPLGFSPVAIVASEKKLVNLPQHLTDTCRQILADVEAVEAINKGKVGFTVYTYDSPRRKGCYSIKFVDVD